VRMSDSTGACVTIKISSLGLVVYNVNPSCLQFANGLPVHSAVQVSNQTDLSQASRFAPCAGPHMSQSLLDHLTH
jgi:hypothetical protein